MEISPTDSYFFQGAGLTLTLSYFISYHLSLKERDFNSLETLKKETLSKSDLLNDK